MGEIRINIPKDMEARLEAVFPGEDKSAVLLRLAQVAFGQVSAATKGEAPSQSNKSFVELANEIRSRSRVVTEEEIRAAREELRK